MVLPMKKLSILVYHKDQQRLLDSLGEHGVVHIETQAPEEQEQVSELSSYLKRCDRALRALKQEKNKSTSLEGKTGEEILEQYETIEEGLSRTDQDINSLEKKIAQLRPWGSIDNETIKKLSEKGIKTSFFEVSTKVFNEIKLGDEAYISVVFQRNSKTGFVAFTREDINVPEAERIHLPDIPLEEAEKELEKDREIKETLLKERYELGAYTDKLAQHIATKRRELEYISAKEGMESAAEGSVLYMKGWFPADKETALKELLDLFNLWYGIDNPAPNESVPVKMNNGRFSKLFEPVTKIFDLPDYFELDPTPFFAPLFAFFFGLCLGDLGYGFIISLVSVIALRKVDEKYKNLAFMGLILGGMTMLCGVFTNTFFGHKIFQFAESGSGLLSKGGGAALLRTVNTESGTYYPVMPFSV
ncbi:MAG: V-type ATPase 116kDa subunit family protein, partial [Chitinivibrionales bacterium]